MFMIQLNINIIIYKYAELFKWQRAVESYDKAIIKKYTVEEKKNKYEFTWEYLIIYIYIGVPSQDRSLCYFKSIELLFTFK